MARLATREVMAIIRDVFVFFFKQKTAYEISLRCLQNSVGSRRSCQSHLPNNCTVNLNDPSSHLILMRELRERGRRYSPSTFGMLHYNTLPRTPSITRTILRALHPFGEDRCA